MNRVNAKSVLASALVVFALFIFSGHYRSNAQPVVYAQSASPGCSVATLHGSYSNIFRILNTSPASAPA
jgi:hypothetical protein